MKAERRHQQYMADMLVYAASLTNASGSILDPENVVVDKTNRKDSSRQTRKNHPVDKSEHPNFHKKSGLKPKGGKKQALLDQIAASNKAKDQANVDKFHSAWRTFRQDLEGEQDLSAMFEKMSDFYRSLPEAKREIIGAEVQFHMICVLVTLYLHSKQITQIMGLKALLWDHLRGLSTHKGITKSIGTRVIEILDFLGFAEIQIDLPDYDRPLEVDTHLHLPRQAIIEPQVKGLEFQCLHCGPYMERNLDSVGTLSSSVCSVFCGAETGSCTNDY